MQIEETSRTRQDGARWRSLDWNRFMIGIAALLVVTGLLSAQLAVDTGSMILGGAADFRHFSWTILGVASATLAFVLAAILVRDRRSLASSLRAQSSEESSAQ